MGKYDKVTGSLPVYQEPKSQQEKIEERQREIGQQYNLTSPRLSDLVAIYIYKRKQKDLVEEELKELNLDIEALTQLVILSMEAEGVDSLRMPELGFSVWQQDEPYPSVEDRDAVRQWAIENGLERSLQLPWQTLSAIVKERLLKGEPEPPGTKTWLRQKLVMRKA